MRRLSAYILLVFMSWQIIGFVGYFETSYFYLKKDIKKLLKKGVPKNQLVHFEFTTEELNALTWIKSNEFSLDGNLFDIVRSEKSHDGKKLKLQCISDKQETILFTKLDQTICMNLGSEKSDSPISNWFKFLNCPTVIPTEEISIELNPYDLQSARNHCKGFTPIEASQIVPDQPPCV